MHIEISNDIIFFGWGMNNIGLVLREMNQIHSILFGIQGPFLCPSFAVINDDLVILGAGDQGSAVGGKVHMVNRILVIPEKNEKIAIDARWLFSTPYLNTFPTRMDLMTLSTNFIS